MTAGKETEGKSLEAAAPLAPSSVSLPTATFPANATNIFAFATVTDTTGNNYIGFQCDFTFNPAVVTFAAGPGSVSPAGLTASGWTVQANVLPGNIVRVTGDSSDSVTPLSGAGQLFRLNMVRQGGNGTSTPLTFAAGSGRFQFFSGTTFTFVDPAGTTNGTISIGPTAIALSSLQAVGYDD